MVTREVFVMNKSITREQIIETALDLLKDRSDIRNVNLREIARVIGCAHTNIYNYFPSFNNLLWEAHIEIKNKFIEQLSQTLESVQDDKAKLHQFYFSLSEFYLDHKGWFRLTWLDYIDNMRPQKDIVATEEVVNKMVEMLETIWISIYQNAPCREHIRGVLHDVNCYIVGEVSNFINGRGLIQDKELLKTHITETAVKFFMYSLNGGITAYAKL